MARFLATRLYNGLQARARQAIFGNRDHSWSIAYRRRGTPAGEWTFLHPPPDRFYADPFLLRRGERTFLFFEDYRYDLEKGIISVVELTAQGRSEIRVALELDGHLSYPFVFEHDGEVYLMPETSASGRVELYRATCFPYEWTLDQIPLENGIFVDPTLHRQNGRWWLFVNAAAPMASTWDELHVFFASTLAGPWQPHPENPVISDVRSARPAGRLFFRNGNLIRPGQDCSLAYGYAVTLNQVVTLTETDYRETPVEKILPEWLPNILGTHTVNHNEDFEVRDVKTPFRKLRFTRG